jgi:hypothetical protein
VELTANQGKAPLKIRARAEVTETSSPVYYTLGVDNKGIYQNAFVAWELYGPNEEDYRSMVPEGLSPDVKQRGKLIEVKTNFSVHRPGTYRLRATTVDLVGRSTVVWNAIVVSE